MAGRACELVMSYYIHTSKQVLIINNYRILCQLRSPPLSAIGFPAGASEHQASSSANPDAPSCILVLTKIAPNLSEGLTGFAAETASAQTSWAFPAHRAESCAVWTWACRWVSRPHRLPFRARPSWSDTAAAHAPVPHQIWNHKHGASTVQSSLLVPVIVQLQSEGALSRFSRMERRGSGHPGSCPGSCLLPGSSLVLMVSHPCWPPLENHS